MAGTGGGSSGSGGVSSGGSSGTGGSGALGGTGATGGSAGSGGNAGTGAGGSGAAGAWTATPDWTTLPLPLQFGPSLAPHPTDPKTFAILATSFSASGGTLIAAATHDLGSSFPDSGALSALSQSAMANAQGIAYNPKNSQELTAVLFVQGDPADPASGAHVYHSTDGGKIFADSPLPGLLPLNALAFTRLRYTSDGSIALRSDASVVYTADGTSITDTVDTADCASQPGNSAFDVNPDDAKTVAVPCGKAVAICSHAGCSKTSVAYDVGDVRYGADGQHLLMIGGSNNEYFALLSTDGGATFTPSQAFNDNVTPSFHVDWDPRPGKNTAYALLVSHLFRSSDGGASWQDITPPPELNYIYDFVVAADGTVIGRGVFHYLLLAPTS